MKILKYILIILFITSVGYSQNVKITDFDIATSTAKQAFLNGFYNWSQTDSKKDSFTTFINRDSIGNITDTVYFSEPGGKTLSSSWQVEGIYNQFYSSPSYAWQYGLTGAIYGQREDPDGLGFRARYNFNADFSKYFSNSTGFFGKFEANSIYNRILNEFEYTDSLGNGTGRYFGGENRPEVNLFAGLGYGRQVNATPLAKAIGVDQELRKSGVTKQYLPKTTMLNISRIIDKESEYKAKYKQTYKAKMIEDIQNEITASGVADATRMNSLGYFRIDNVLFENYEGSINYSFTNPRYYGGDISLGIGYQALTRNPAIDIPDPSLESIGRYGYPIGLNQQLYAGYDMRTPFDSTFGKVWEGNARLDYWFNMTNRIRFFTNYTLNLVRDTRTVNGNLLSSDFSYTNHNVGAGFLFYLENYVTFQVQGAYSFLHDQSETFSTNAVVSFILF